MATRRHHDGRFAKPGEAISAEAAYAAKQVELAARHAVPKGGTVKLHPLFQNRLADLQLDSRDHKTIERNRQSFIRLTSWLAEQGIEPPAVSERDLRRYFKWLLETVAPATANTEATQVNSAYRCAAEDGLIATNPVTRRVTTPPAPVRDPEPYSHEELRRIRAALMSDFEEVLFYAFAYGGLRRHELVEMERESVDFTAAVLKVRGKGSDGGKERRVPLHPIVSRVLTSYFKRHPATTVLGRGGSMRNVNHRFGKLFDRAGVERSNRPVHRIRKTAATSLRREGVHPDVIDRIFGWSPTSVRQRYYGGVDDEELHEAILRLYASDPVERPPLRIADEMIAAEVLAPIG